MLQDQEIKGFSILELLVVLAIIGVISAVGYPNFSKWKKDRDVRVGTEKIFNLMNGVITQTKRGEYAYVQIHADFTGNSFKILSKGMARSTFGKAINENTALDCGDTIVWDNSKISEFNAVNVSLDFNEDSSICFSKAGSHYKMTGGIDKHSNQTIESKSKKDYMFICAKVDAKDNSYKCPGTSSIKKDQPLYLITWSRFGIVNKFKWINSEWRRV